MVTIIYKWFLFNQKKTNLSNIKICVNTWLLPCKMSEKFHKILKYKEDENSVKILFVIYTDTESLLKSIQICDNYPGKSCTLKKKNMQRVAFQNSQNFHSAANKIIIFITEVNTVWNFFVEI